MYLDAFKDSRILSPFQDCEKWPCTCPDCYGSIELTPLHVDDKSGIHFLRCPVCESIYLRPAWYETPEERIIRGLVAKIAELEARITALEHRPAIIPRLVPAPSSTPAQKHPQNDVIELPELLTVS